LIDEGIELGVRWLQDYYANRIWEEIGVRSASDRRALEGVCGPLNHNLPAFSALGIVNFLRDHGSLEELEKQMRAEYNSTFGRDFPSNDELPTDSFELWRLHYKLLGQSGMVDRIDLIEQQFYELFLDGAPYSSAGRLRILNHGVIGGLLLLKYSTLWFKLTASAQLKAHPNWNGKGQLRRKILTAFGAPKLKVDHCHWFNAVIWATAAVASHDLLQVESKPAGWKPLCLSDDPLIYLGILVDMLQDWDRHSTRRIASIETKRRIVKSRDVQIGIDHDDRLCIQYGLRGDADCRARQEKLETELNATLDSWADLVSFQFQSAEETRG